MVTATVEEKPTCPECGSDRLIKNGQRYKKRQLVQQYQCRACGRITTNPIWR